ncbi:hypothetical protein PAAG_04384 [Paracoccidioides lutzii Pb01]|uniref:Uncharacterized protein n=1 Tax=Paracoccidioides lutzii (strain ATCC MYA-826 / Pb01) TaxID=502779 RepID=C1H0U0_PARBA|nr:hypothetical protein PAAG_04384 [Paracoccidioides lutzii Pb01]EEH33334.2 hypothetical protein PAAG_04384 [Paracoccidioides lutzii Pb01]
MSNYDTYKTFLILLSPILFRQAKSLYNSLRTSLSHRPPPRPVPHTAARALNLLFLTTTLFLLLSLPTSSGLNPFPPAENIFTLTSSRLNTPTEILFSRLARQRPNNTLSQTDTILKRKNSPPPTLPENLYLRFGPRKPSQTCPFLHPPITNQAISSTTLPTKNLPCPHLLHSSLPGFITSDPLTGPSASRWRAKFTLSGLSLLLLETLLVTIYNPTSSTNTTNTNPQIVPPSFHTRLTTARYLSFTLTNALYALIIYLSSTHRFFYIPPTPSEIAEKLVANVSATLAGATAKMHALSVVRNATVRDRALKGRDDAYWTAVVEMEQVDNDEGGGGGGGGGAGVSIWEEEEVVRAMTKVMQGRGGGGVGEGKEGAVDIAQLGMEASAYVEGITEGLEMGG